MDEQQRAEYFGYIWGVIAKVIEETEFKAHIGEALKSVVEKYPTVSYKDSEKAFANVFDVYLKSVDLIKKKEKEFLKYSKENKLDSLIDAELKAYKKIDIPDQTLRQMLEYIFYHKFATAQAQ